jgi:hypothetical protein
MERAGISMTFDRSSPRSGPDRLEPSDDSIVLQPWAQNQWADAEILLMI